MTTPRVRAELRDALAANNAAYRFCDITREQWTARNRELQAEADAAGLDMALPAFALEDVA